MAALVRGAKYTSLFACRRLILRSNIQRNISLWSRNRTLLIARAQSIENNVFIRAFSAEATAIPDEAVAAEEWSSVVEPRKQAQQTVTVDRHLIMINEQVKRSARLGVSKVYGVLKLMKRQGTVDDQQAAMLLRCTGKLLQRLSKVERQKVLQDVQQGLLQMGATFTTIHYNAILRSKIDNEEDFSATDFLADMESNGIIPNRITFQLLISKYCFDADVEGASKIIAHMKEKRMPINEQLFSSLITGYMKQGLVKEADDVLVTMRQSGLDPTSESYNSLLCGHARRGDIEAIMQTLSNAEKDEVLIRACNILNTIETLVDAGHEEHVTQMLDLLERKHRYSNDAINSMLQLVANNADHVAARVFLKMAQSNKNIVMTDEHEPNMLVKAMVEKKKPLATVFEVAAMVQEGGLTENELERLALHAIRSNSASCAREILQHLKDNGREVQPHQLWPIFKAESRTNGYVEELYKTIKLCLSACENEHKAMIQVAQKAMKGLMRKGQTMEQIQQTLQEIGFKEESIKILRFFGYMTSGQYEDAYSYAQQESVPMIASLVKSELPSGFQACRRDMGATMEMLRQCSEFAGVPMISVNASVILNFFIAQNLKPEEAVQLITLAVEKELKIPARIQPSVIIQLRQLKVPNEIVEKVSELAASAKEEKLMVTPNVDDWDKMIVTQLEEQHARQVKLGRGTFDVRRRLLMSYCRQGNSDQVAGLKGLLDAEGFVYQAETLRSLGVFYAVKEKNLQESLKCIDMLKSQYPTYSYYSGLILQAATLQAKEGKVNDAFSLVENHLSQHFKSSKQQQSAPHKVSETHLLESLGLALLAELSEPHDAHRMTELLFQHFIKGGSFKLLARVIKGFIEREDADGLVPILQQYASEYQRVPEFSNVLSMLIRKEDARRLQKVVDILTPLLGENSVLHYLAIHFVEQNKVKQARKILETPGLRVNMTLLKSGCERFYMGEKITAMSQLVEVTKAMPYADRDEMLFQLIRMHVSQRDIKAAMDVYLTYEEENLIPKPRTLRYLGKVLEEHHIQVPFIIPDLQEGGGGGAGNKKSLNPLEEAARDALNNLDVAKVVSMKVHGPNPDGDELSDAFLVRESIHLLKLRKKEVEELVLAHAEENASMFSLLFNFYVNNDRLADAHNLIQKYPQQKKRLFLVNVLRHLKSADKENVILEIRSMFSGEEEKAALGPIYSHLIALKCDAGDWQGGVSYYSQAMDAGYRMEQLSVRPLLMLESMLQQNSQPLPWQSGAIQSQLAAKDRRRQRQQESGSSDSSDSSDSDEEDTNGK